MKNNVFSVVLFMLSIITCICVGDYGTWYEKVAIVFIELVIMLGNILSDGVKSKFLQSRIVEFFFFYGTLFLGGRAYDLVKEAGTIDRELLCHSIMLPVVWFWFHRFTVEKTDSNSAAEKEVEQKEIQKDLEKDSSEEDILQLFDLPERYTLKIDGDKYERVICVFRENTLIYKCAIVVEELKDRRLFYIEDISRMVEEEINDHISGRILDGIVKMANVFGVQAIALNPVVCEGNVDNALSQDELVQLLERHIEGKDVELIYCKNLDELMQ